MTEPTEPQRIALPSLSRAPFALHQLEGNCGVMTAWGVLRFFHKRTASARLMRSCRYTKKHGTFTIALAVALREHGLQVDFYSDPDPAPYTIERRCYRLAQTFGVVFHAGTDLADILAQINQQTIAVALYNTEDDIGHMSPVLPGGDKQVFLPYAETPENLFMAREQFVQQWSAPEIYRQCLVVRR